jgi:hypothetical protein
MCGMYVLPCTRTLCLDGGGGGGGGDGDAVDYVTGALAASSWQQRRPSGGGAVRLT